MIEAGAKKTLVKLHDGGCVFASKDHTSEVRAPSVQVVDKTGAGDAFAGALAWAILEGRSDQDAARTAVAAAAFAVTRWGSQPSYPARDELEELIPRVTVLQDGQSGAGLG